MKYFLATLGLGAQGSIAAALWALSNYGDPEEALVEVMVPVLSVATFSAIPLVVTAAVVVASYDSLKRRGLWPELPPAS